MFQNILILIVEVFAATAAAAIIHEGGHALATLACRVRLRSFVLGIGPNVLELRARSTDVVLKLLPITGHITRDLTRRRLASLAITAAGPMANLITLGLIFIAYLLRPRLVETLLIFGFYEALFVVATLLPLTREVNGVKIGSDGMKIFNLLFRHEAGTFV
jgi:membrane-associated protease RseP (regulator of RpoE activity)